LTLVKHYQPKRLTKMDKLTRKKAIESFHAKFNSYNDCEVSQATITREEYEAVIEAGRLLEQALNKAVFDDIAGANK